MIVWSRAALHATAEGCGLRCAESPGRWADARFCEAGDSEFRVHALAHRRDGVHSQPELPCELRTARSLHPQPPRRGSSVDLDLELALLPLEVLANPLLPADLDGEPVQQMHEIVCSPKASALGKPRALRRPRPSASSGHSSGSECGHADGTNVAGRSHPGARRIIRHAPDPLDKRGLRPVRRDDADQTKRVKTQPASRDARGWLLIYQAAVGGLRRLLPADYSRERERGCLDGFAIQIALDTRLRIFP